MSHRSGQAEACTPTYGGLALEMQGEIYYSSKLERFEEWQKAWRIAAANGSTDSLLDFICRESGISEETFLQKLADTLGCQFATCSSDMVQSPAHGHL